MTPKKWCKSLLQQWWFLSQSLSNHYWKTRWSLSDQWRKMIDQLPTTCPSAQLYAPKNVRVFRKANGVFSRKFGNVLCLKRSAMLSNERERFGIKSSCIEGSFRYGLCLSCFGKVCRKRVRALPMMRQKKSKNERQRWWIKFEFVFQKNAKYDHRKDHQMLSCNH